jgi:hypothetical protein
MTSGFLQLESTIHIQFRHIFKIHPCISYFIHTRYFIKNNINNKLYKKLTQIVRPISY